jgi:6-phosphogluconolactonase
VQWQLPIEICKGFFVTFDWLSGAFFFLHLAVFLPSCSGEDPSEAGGGGSSTSAGGTVGAGGSEIGAGGGSGGKEAGSGGSVAGGADATGGDGGGASGGSGATGGSAATGGSGGGESLKTYVYVGSGHWSGETGKVTVYTMNRATRELSFVSDHDAGSLASFLAIDGDGGRLYAVDEADGGVWSFVIDKSSGQLTPLGRTESGNQPVYLSLSRDGRYLLAANYNQGNVDLYPIGSDGKAGGSIQTVATGQYAHCVFIDESDNVFVPNKGSDNISQFSLVGGMLSPNAVPSVDLASPRHILVRGAKAYAVSEDADLVTGYEVGLDGTLTEQWQTARRDSGTTNGSSKGADIHLTPDGKYLYASNREPENSIVAYDISSGEPSLIEHEPTQGGTPRNFAMDPQGEFLIVGHHEDPKTVVVFDIAADGSLEFATKIAPEFSAQFVSVVQF